MRIDERRFEGYLAIDLRQDAPPAREAPEDRAARFIQQAPTSADYASMLADVAAAAPLSRDRAVQRGLDDLRDRFSGPYVVDGATVTARPMFRMDVVKNSPQTNATLIAAAGRSRAGDPYSLTVGQGTPAQLVKVTQALIDMGRLPPGPGDVATRIRRMQWEHGIGVDCAGYCKEAIRATAGASVPMGGPGNESFRDLDSPPRSAHFAKQSIVDVRPGDLVTLDPSPPETWGHNVVVYRHDVADAASKRALATLHGDTMKAFLASPGPHRVLEVDSSWGAGPNGADFGGFRRDTWIYDESTKTWGSFAHEAPHAFVTSPDGPSGDRYHGAYRAR